MKKVDEESNRRMECALKPSVMSNYMVKNRLIKQEPLIVTNNLPGKYEGHISRVDKNGTMFIFLANFWQNLTSLWYWLSFY